jgi:hypothetical protein
MRFHEFLSLFDFLKFLSADGHLSTPYLVVVPIIVIEYVLFAFFFRSSSTAKSKHQVQGRVSLNVVVGQSIAIFELFTGKNEALLIWRNAFFVLNFILDVFNSVAKLNLKIKSLACQSLDSEVSFL